MMRRGAEVAGLVLAVLIAAGCSGEEAPVPAPGEPAAAATPAPEPERAASPPTGTPQPPPRRRTATAAPRYFAHARFVPLRDDENRPVGLLVEKVLPGGRVALAGVQAGDILHAIDQIPLDDPATFDQAVRIAEDVFLDRRPEHMVVTRNGRKVGLMPLGPLAPAKPAAPAP